MITTVTTDLRTQITDLLTDLARGGSADSVADALRARQITGHLHDTCDCPIANLIKTVPSVDQVDVVNGHAVVWETGDDEPYNVTLPIAVSDFIYLFDEGVFLDLVPVPGSAVAS